MRGLHDATMRGLHDTDNDGKLTSAPAASVTVMASASAVPPATLPKKELRIKIRSLIKTLNTSYELHRGRWVHSDKLMNICVELGISYAIDNGFVVVAGIVTFFTENETAMELRDGLLLP